jgi:hypothetical protein
MTQVTVGENEGIESELGQVGGFFRVREHADA